ncbi:hypothetical protein [Seonamhaeicola sp.]|uniref:tetratricopeptide repeat protein n=1 Tax=Seonamhaeicola sp. TaxID=1912245 RepID=UPI0026205399|nr:hypothetical protein [Seonamhaeicola sp.]
MDDFSDYKEHPDLELLIDYVDGILDAEMNAKIAHHLEQSDASKNIVDGIRFYYETYGADRKGLENYLQETKDSVFSKLDIPEDQPASLKKTRTLRYYIPRIAAAVLLLMIPVFIFVYQGKSSALLIDDYLSVPYDKPPVMRGDFDQNMALWNKVAFQYESQNYREAIQVLDSLIRQNETRSMAHFYTGLCYLYLETPAPYKAILHLQKAIDTESPFMEQGLWYLSLAYFKAEEKDLGKKTLKRIEGYKYEEAQNLMSNLK